ncbi:hypothetical protein Hypma_012094 [Hypsizygus marmoreus]|uniref:F-box domain-containing protein n=1 Tax=Hypsizygus marmoreus TaxID=39966 RepID=A0A369JF00_HYPMA|nr:hypothetical protein Hypma_012094 [Hypsizygus marmoreus]
MLRSGYSDFRRWIDFDVSRSNSIALSGHDREAAKQFLSDVHEDLDQLDLEIARTQAILDDLKARRDTIASRTDKIRTALAPHKGLPPELLREIFQHSLDGRPFVIPIRSEQNWPWPLRSVCSAWRKLAVSDYRLWSDISVRLRKWDSQLHDRLVRAIVDICSPTVYSRGPMKMDIDVSGDLGYPIAEPSPLRLLSRFLPCLREVSLSFPSDYSGHFQNEIHKFFSGALHLRKLKINCSDEVGGFNDFRWFDEVPGVPWAQLTALDLSRACQPVESAMQILRLCPRLEVCTISVQTATNHPGIDQLTLPHLKSLTVNQGSCPEAILDHLVTPSLVDLRLFLDQLVSFSEILSLLHRSGASLEVFWCSDNVGPNRTQGVEGFLEQVPTLLEFQMPVLFPTSVLQRVSRGELLPCMEVWKCGLLLDAVDAFIDAVERRLTPGTSALPVLRKAHGCVSIDPGNDDMQGPLQRMERIREQCGGDFKLLGLDDESLA